MERFFAQTQRSGACLVWTGAILKSGYGRFSRGRKAEGNAAAHRYAWELAHGAIPDGLLVLHKCDNRRCVDVEHLFLGTQADNMTDKKAKGRQARGERAPKAKLTEAQVLELRAEAAAGVRVSVLARKYDLNRNNIAKIIARKSWSHL
ncbi:HNH endonuclease [Deinococcus aquaticus]|uniref:HNH endonuclease n=1 Tax=Deinococcus aquaticus TaxID=328692 RepID=UPI003F45692F